MKLILKRIAKRKNYTIGNSTSPPWGSRRGVIFATLLSRRVLR